MNRSRNAVAPIRLAFNLIVAACLGLCATAGGNEGAADRSATGVARLAGEGSPLRKGDTVAFFGDSVSERRTGAGDRHAVKVPCGVDGEAGAAVDGGGAAGDDEEAKTKTRVADGG